MLHLIGVSKSFGEPRPVSVLRDVHLAAGTGSVVCISGPVGAGKSTLIRLALGEIAADQGEVRVFGRDLARLQRSSLLALRRKLAWIPQEIRLIEDASCLDNVAIAGEAAGQSLSRARLLATELLAEVGLAEAVDVPPRILSSGQRRRVCIARALVVEPELILADEPSGDLDTAAVSELVRAISRRAEHGVTTLVTTHDERLLERARTLGWSHLQLVAGRLEMPARIAPVPARADAGAVVVPFPNILRAGGAE